MVLGGNEFHVEGMGLVLQVLEAAGGGGGGAVESFGFVVGLSADHALQRVLTHRNVAALQNTDVEAGGRPRPGAVVKMRSGRAAFVFDRPRLQCFAWPHEKDAKPACSSTRSISHSAARLRLTTL